jgi:hypothetical protein
MLVKYRRINNYEINMSNLTKIKKRQKNIAVCKQSIKEQEDLVNKLQSLS